MEIFTTKDLIKELQAYVNEERELGGVTVAEWAEAQGVTHDYARKQLAKMIGDGILTRKKARVDGRRTFVYYKVTPEALS